MRMVDARQIKEVGPWIRRIRSREAPLRTRGDHGEIARRKQRSEPAASIGWSGHAGDRRNGRMGAAARVKLLGGEAAG